MAEAPKYVARDYSKVAAPNTESVESSIVSETIDAATSCVNGILDTIITKGFNYSLQQVGIHLSESELKKIYSKKNIVNRIYAIGLEYLLQQDKTWYILNPLHIRENINTAVYFWLGLKQSVFKHALPLQQGIIQAENEAQDLPHGYTHSDMYLLSQKEVYQEDPFQFTALPLNQVKTLIQWIKNPLTERAQMLRMLAVLGTCLRQEISITPVLGVGFGMTQYPSNLPVDCKFMFPADFTILDPTVIKHSLMLSSTIANEWVKTVFMGAPNSKTKDHNWYCLCLTLRVLEHSKIDFYKALTSTLNAPMMLKLCNFFDIKPDNSLNWYKILLKQLGIKSTDCDALKQFCQLFPTLTIQQFNSRFKSAIDRYTIPDFIVITQIENNWWERLQGGSVTGTQIGNAGTP